MHEIHRAAVHRDRARSERRHSGGRCIEAYKMHVDRAVIPECGRDRKSRGQRSPCRVDQDRDIAVAVLGQTAVDGAAVEIRGSDIALEM